MNYGRFFRLNRSLSEIENGIAIYDYVDLPAYFTPSVDNHVSPKYPISVIISSSSVIFRLHYSAYKVEEKEKGDYTYYIYDSIELKADDKKKIKTGDNVNIAHMEEVILELPFINNPTSVLSDTIKNIYITPFPQLIENTSTGGRFLEQKINKRYPKAEKWESLDKLRKKGDLEDLLYGTLREASDDSPSYSTLWLMDLMRNVDVKGYENKKRINLYDENDGKSVIAFLRKLLLDFMFDLKHSDVFQNSANYQQMYSGLMSDFYFSALMHKCEYYYYRDLVTKEMAKEDGMTVDDKKRILTLYGDNLRKTEELWTQDIMNPVSEKYFEYSFGNTHEVKKEKKDSIQQTWIEKIKGWGVVFVQKCKSPKNSIDKFLVKSHILEDNKLIRRESWFAEPEEEMRRVCFPMDDKDNFKHLCNVELMVNYLRVSNSEPSALTEYVNNNKEKISRWFLRRYDFNDVCHLHLSRWSNLISFSSILLLILLFVLSNFLFEGFIKIIDSFPFWPMWESLLLLSGFAAIIYTRNKQKKSSNPSLLSTFVSQNSQRILNFIIFIALSVVIVNINWKWTLMGLLAVFVVCLLCEKSRFLLENNLKKLTSYLHLFFPRLVASITTAWLTMSMRFDIYVAFFDQHVSPPTAFMILIIVFIFVMYEINRITPQTQIWKKLLRGCQLVVISYGISLVVGTIVINFVGRQYMDRGDGFGNITFTSGTVDTDTKPHRVIMKDFTFGDLSKDQQKRIMHDVHCENNNCQSITVFHFGEHEVFFMRDFLIMFSFVTMFMGIFLQMFIFEDKKMTEF